MFKKFSLENKLRIISSPVDGSNSLTMMVLVKIGSRNEDDLVWGGAHYIEHLMFKGTNKRPSTLIISKELDALGAEFNAFTGKEYTVYYVKSNQKHFQRVCDLLFDMLNDSLFDSIEMEREKNVIVEEIKMYYENPLMHIDELYEEVLFSGNRLGLDIAGSRDSVLSMNRDNVIAFRDRGYTSDNMIVCLAGAVNESIIKTCEDTFNRYGRTEKNGMGFDVYKQDQTGVRLKLQERSTEQVQLMMGFHTPQFNHKDIPVLKLMSIILGGNMSSRLFINIRERRGLCYSVGAYLDAYEDVGTLRISAGLDKNRLDEAILAIKEELQTLALDGVTSEELKRAKDFMDGKTTLKLEDTFEWARWYGMQELMNVELKTPEEKLEELANVTDADVARVAKDIIKLEKLNLAIIGPYGDQDHFLKLLS